MTPDELDFSLNGQLAKATSRFRRNLPFFAEMCLKIRTKDSKIVAMEMNKAQRYLHMCLEKQKKEKGLVRAIVLKGRQQGISTYIAARFYRRASLFPGTNVYILTHEQSATDSLFGMVDRYQHNNPIAPETGTANAKELSFKAIDSSYIVGTAGGRPGGRSRTMTLFHGSEVAFWMNAAEHFKASGQTVPYLPGTEIILESTANGVSGEFYERWQDAEAEKSGFLAVFIPWYWQPEYEIDVPHDFELSSENVDEQLSEVEYATLFKLSDRKMAWRRMKMIDEFRGSSEAFDQEYPATSAMAFQTSGEGTFIKSGSVLKARKTDQREGGGPLIMGVDPAGAGGDRFAVAFRRGHVVEKIIWRDKIDATEAVNWLDDLIVEHKPALVNVDAGGLGRPVIDFLRAKKPHYKKLVKAINFGGTSQAKNARPKMPGPKRRRDEMWLRMKEWLQLEEGVALPDIDALQGDMCSVKIKPNLNNDTELESKQEMRKRKIRSPDLADAVALTFADLSFIENYVDAKRNVAYEDPDVMSTMEYGFGGEQGWQG